MLQNKIFIGEIQTVYRFSSSAVVKVDISTVRHLISDAVENCVVVGEHLIRYFAHPVFTRAQFCEVSYGHRNSVSKQPEYNSAFWDASD